MILAIGDCYLDIENKKLLKDIDKNQEFNIEAQAIELLIFLSQNQHKLMLENDIVHAIWPQQNHVEIQKKLPQMVCALNDTLRPQNQADVISGVITDVITVIDSEITGHYYLLTLPTFEYHYTPITYSEMKRKLAEKQLQTLTKQQKLTAAKINNRQQTQNHDQGQNNKLSLSKKLLISLVLAIGIIGFFAATR